MEYLLPTIEQLDLAASLMLPTDPVRSRLALILTDNIVELLAHVRCEDMVRWHEAFKRVRKVQYTEKD
ncbi:MAG TPA: hypothetical protein VKA44_09810, partial [Gemmatimonadota bacterium]|nr:hypothetical protein [Gemmatimonadota bacterium]